MTNNKYIIDLPNQTLLVSMHADFELECQFPRLFRNTLDQRVTISPNSKIVIPVKPKDEIPYGTTIIFDNTVQVLKNKGVLVLLAKSICRISWEELPLRVMNVKDEP